MREILGGPSKKWAGDWRGFVLGDFGDSCSRGDWLEVEVVFVEMLLLLLFFYSFGVGYWYKFAGVFGEWNLVVKVRVSSWILRSYLMCGVKGFWFYILISELYLIGMRTLIYIFNIEHFFLLICKCTRKRAKNNCFNQLID